MHSHDKPSDEEESDLICNISMLEFCPRMLDPSSTGFWNEDQAGAKPACLLAWQLSMHRSIYGIAGYGQWQHHGSPASSAHGVQMGVMMSFAARVCRCAWCCVHQVITASYRQCCRTFLDQHAHMLRTFGLPNPVTMYDLISHAGESDADPCVID